MSTSTQAVPIEQHTGPLAETLCQQLRHQNAIAAQTLDRIFHWFHLLRTNNNGSQPPDIISYLTLLTNQLRFTHQVNSTTIDQLIRWFTFEGNISNDISNDIRTFDNLRTTDRQDINNLQWDVKTIDATNLQNKQQIDDLYNCRDDIGRIWALIVLLEGQNKVYQVQISKLQTDLILAQTTATRALKRAKRSHNVEPETPPLGWSLSIHVAPFRSHPLPSPSIRLCHHHPVCLPLPVHRGHFSTSHSSPRRPSISLGNPCPPRAS